MKLFIMITLYVLAAFLSTAALFTPAYAVLDPERRHPVLAAAPVLVSAVMFAFPLAGALIPDGPLCRFFQRWGNVFLGFILYFFVPLLLARAVLAVIPGGGGAKNIPKRNGPARRIFAVLLSALFIFSLCVNVFGAMAARDVKVTRYEIPKETLGLETAARIVLVSDLHMGVNSGIKLYEDMVSRINEQDADVVAVTGDIVTSSFGAMPDRDACAAVLSGIRSKCGVYVVYGNHDVEEPLLGGFTYVGAEKAYRHPDMEAFLRDCGWTLLTDEVTRLPEPYGFYIAGRRDESRPGDGVTERAPLAQLLEGVDPSAPILLLEHEPSDLDTMGGLGVDLSLSGHTHDGQIFPGNVFARIKGPQSYGMKQWGTATAVVTSGVGYYGPPIRFGTISEIVVIDAV